MAVLAIWTARALAPVVPLYMSLSTLPDVVALETSPEAMDMILPSSKRRNALSIPMFPNCEYEFRLLGAHTQLFGSVTRPAVGVPEMSLPVPALLRSKSPLRMPPMVPNGVRLAVVERVTSSMCNKVHHYAAFCRYIISFLPCRLP